MKKTFFLNHIYTYIDKLLIIFQILSFHNFTKVAFCLLSGILQKCYQCELTLVLSKPWEILLARFCDPKSSCAEWVESDWGLRYVLFPQLVSAETRWLKWHPPASKSFSAYVWHFLSSFRCSLQPDRAFRELLGSMWDFDWKLHGMTFSHPILHLSEDYYVNTSSSSLKLTSSPLPKKWWMSKVMPACQSMPRASISHFLLPLCVCSRRGCWEINLDLQLPLHLPLLRVGLFPWEPAPDYHQ